MMTNCNPSTRRKRGQTLDTRHSTLDTRRAGFTMIEIAISLGVIGFALVAIIGILPRGLEAQRDNREETIINYDANVFMNAICNGQQGLDDLTNSVVSITISQTGYSYDNVTGLVTPQSPTTAQGFSVTDANPATRLTNGFRIIGLLSTPKYVPVASGTRVSAFVSNHVVAIVRSLTGAASDKFPQRNPDVQGFAFTYKLIAEVVPYGFGPSAFTGAPQGIENNAWNQDWTNYLPYVSATQPAWQWQSRSNFWLYAKNVQQDFYDVRLLFRWPVTPQGTLPPNGRRLVFRSATSGPVRLVPDASQLYPLYFAQPRTFVKAP
jgi:type II secretory pathway pseudopilin PulG